MLYRRAVLLGGLAVAVGAAGCLPSRPGGPPDMGAPTSREHPSRLTARPPAAGPVTDPQPGVHVLDLGPGPEVLLRVSSGMDDGTRGRLVLTLHGAGADARAGLGPLPRGAAASRSLLLAPKPQGSTGDVVGGGGGPDVRRIDDALEEVFAS